MNVEGISAAGLSQFVLATSTDTYQLNQALQTLQNDLAANDLIGAETAYQRVQMLYQKALAGSGSDQTSNSQISSDLTTLGNALSSGDLSSAQSAFATVQSDFKAAATASQAAEANAASQSVALVDELLGSVEQNSSSTNASDPADAILQAVYGSKGVNTFE